MKWPIVFHKTLGLNRGGLKPELEIAGYSLHLKRMAKARHFRLRIDPCQRRLIMTLPQQVSLKKALAFAESQTEWIRAQFLDLPPILPLAPGRIIPLEGEDCRLEQALLRQQHNSLYPKTMDQPQKLYLYGEGQAFATGLFRSLEQRALEKLRLKTETYRLKLGQDMPLLALSRAKGRWGSCRPAQKGHPAKIRYHWRLILAPPFVLDYVAAHECAHLIEANHSARFWAVAETLYGQSVTPARSWLKQNGSRLHAVL